MTSIVLFLGALAAGCTLRLHLLASQVFLDDEWHSVNQVIRRSAWDVLTNLNPRNNSSVPFNLYNWWLYHGAHWSEWTLRLPSIVAGIATIALLPWMVRRNLGDRVAVTFAVLLSIAPFLVFYSRFARAYSAAALLGFASVLLIHRWMTSGRTRDGVIAVVVATLAIYVHLSTIVAVFAPLAVGAVSRRRTAVTIRALVSVGLILSVVSLPLIVPSLFSSARLPWMRGTPTAQGIGTMLTLLAGTAVVPFVLAVFLLALWGFVRLYRSEPLLGGMVLAVPASSIALFLVSRPEGIGTGLVMLRYMIVAVPIVLLCVAVGLDGVAARLTAKRPQAHEPTTAALAAALAGGLFLAGPLPALQRGPNDFMGHTAFQGSYEPVGWERSDARHLYPAFSLRQDQISPFYRWLAGRPDVTAIVEYPFDVCNYNDLFYFYQHVHGKRVFAGYCSDPLRTGERQIFFDPRHPKAALNMLDVDDILDRVPHDRRTAFRNMVDLTHLDELASSGAGIVVLHKFVVGTRTLEDGSMDTVPVRFSSVDLFSAELRDRFGPPVFEDTELVSFAVRGPAAP